MKTQLAHLLRRRPDIVMEYVAAKNIEICISRYVSRTAHTQRSKKGKHYENGDIIATLEMQEGVDVRNEHATSQLLLKETL